MRCHLSAAAAADCLPNRMVVMACDFGANLSSGIAENQAKYAKTSLNNVAFREITEVAE